MSSLGNNIGCQEYQQADKTLFETRVKGQRPIQRLCTFLWYYSFNFCLFFIVIRIYLIFYAVE